MKNLNKHNRYKFVKSCSLPSFSYKLVSNIVNTTFKILFRVKTNVKVLIFRMNLS